MKTSTEKMFDQLSKMAVKLDGIHKENVSQLMNLNANGNEQIEKIQQDLPSLIEKMKNGNPTEIVKNYAECLSK